MISYIELRNFRTFSHVFWDLRGPHGVPKQLVYLYGENGMGKTHLISSITFIQQMLKFSGSTDSALASLIRSHKSAFSDEPMRIKIGLYTEGNEGFYSVKFRTTLHQESLITEKLYFTMHKRAGYLFDLDGAKKRLSRTVFHNTKFRKCLLTTIEKDWGKNSFLSQLAQFRRSLLAREWESSCLPVVGTVIRLIERIGVLNGRGLSSVQSFEESGPLLTSLRQGKVCSLEDPKLRITEDFIRYSLVQFFSDIKNVYYRYQQEDGGYIYTLFVEKLCAGSIVSVPIHDESTGIRKFIQLLPFIYACLLGRSICIDSMEGGLHEIIQSEFVKTLRNAIQEKNNAQWIATTQNILLLRILQTREISMLTGDALGHKQISSINEYVRTHPNHSIFHRYLSGLYQGVPMIGYVDWLEILTNLQVGVRR